MSPKVIGIAAGAVLLVLVVVGLATLRRTPANANALLAPDAYAASLPVDGVTLSEATNGTGGKVTYVDGQVRNTGGKTVTSATVQVTFVSADGTAPQRQTVPLTLIRTRVPYVDLEPVGAEPIGPGQSHDFRLIFETVPAGWNTQAPGISLIHAETR